jgi:uncharacterized protein
LQKHHGTTLFSAGDVVAFLECEHATTLALQDLETPLARAQDDESRVAEIFQAALQPPLYGRAERRVEES